MLKIQHRVKTNTVRKAENKKKHLQTLNTCKNLSDYILQRKQINKKKILESEVHVYNKNPFFPGSGITSSLTEQMKLQNSL